MRELPANFEVIKKEMIDIGTILLERYNIPARLVVNLDETAALLVNRAKRTRDRSGNKRVRVIGMGSDKAQITVTLIANESGEILDYQCIWGGKTARCHPPANTKLPGVLWSHTKSHWQDENTFIDIFTSILIPYRTLVIEELGFSALISP